MLAIYFSSHSPFSGWHSPSLWSASHFLTAVWLSSITVRDLCLFHVLACVPRALWASVWILSPGYPPPPQLQAQRLINNLKRKHLPVSSGPLFCQPHLLSKGLLFGGEHMNAACRFLPSTCPTEEALSFGTRMNTLPCVPSCHSTLIRRALRWQRGNHQHFERCSNFEPVQEYLLKPQIYHFEANLFSSYSIWKVFEAFW